MAAWVVLSLGTLVVLAGVVALVNGVREGVVAVPPLAVTALVLLAMWRAAPKTREAAHRRPEH